MAIFRDKWTNPQISMKRLGVGFIGSGFITRFHIQSWQAVRDADIRGIWSPNRAHAEAAAALARELHVGEARAFDSIEAMVADPSIDAIWICGPNHARIENMEAIVDALERGKGELVGVACEKPLARNVAEARRMVELVERAGLLHGYLEDQLFTPAIRRGREILWKRGAALTGRPYLARAAEEHSGPHAPWFWFGNLQGGGVQAWPIAACVRRPRAFRGIRATPLAARPAAGCGSRSSNSPWPKPFSRSAAPCLLPRI